MGLIFTNTTCVLSQNFISNISDEKLQNALMMVGKQTGVTVDKRDLSFVFTGDWDEIFQAHTCLKDIYKQEVCCLQLVEETTQGVHVAVGKCLEGFNEVVNTDAVNSATTRDREPDTDILCNSSQFDETTFVCDSQKLHKNASEESSLNETETQAIHDCSKILKCVPDSDTNYSSVDDNTDKNGQYISKNDEKEIFLNEIKLEDTIGEDTINGKDTVGLIFDDIETQIKKEIPQSEELCVGNSSFSSKEHYTANGKKEISEHGSDGGEEIPNYLDSAEREQRLAMWVNDSEGKKFKCNKCFKRFGTKMDLQSHVYRAHYHEGYHCKLCNKRYKFNSKRHYIKHQQKCKGNNIKTHQGTIDSSENYCDIEIKTKLSDTDELVSLKQAVGSCKEYRCEKCNYVGNNQECLQSHVARKHQKKLACGICFKQFGLHRELLRHIRCTHTDEGYRCDICNKVYRINSMRHYKKHLQSHAENGIFTDIKISGRKERIKIKISGDKHNEQDGVTARQGDVGEAKEQDGETARQGDVGEPKEQDGETARQGDVGEPKEQLIDQEDCSYMDEDTDIDEQYLDTPNGEESTSVHGRTGRLNNQELELSDSIPKDNIVSQVQENFAFYCRFCDQSFRFSREYRKHMMGHEDDCVDPQHECERCHLSFSTQKMLQAHFEFKHIRAESMKRGYTCGVCNRMFKIRHKYLLHMEVHADKKKYLCDICGKAFKQEKCMESHKHMHDEEKKFACHVCAKTFRHSSGLRLHLRIHKDSKDYICSTCGKGFSQRGALVRHERIHSGAKPFKCALCSRTFNDYSIIRRHMIMLHDRGTDPNIWRGDIIRTYKSLKNTENEIKEENK